MARAKPRQSQAQPDKLLGEISGENGGGQWLKENCIQFIAVFVEGCYASRHK